MLNSVNSNKSLPLTLAAEAAEQPLRSDTVSSTVQLSKTTAGALVPTAYPIQPSQTESTSCDDKETLSKNQLKKLKKKQEWEAGKDARRARRKEKVKERKLRKKASIADDLEQVISINVEDAGSTTLQKSGKTNGATLKYPARPIQFPITIILDCQFDDLMTDNERTSLGTQLTRSYSDNRKAQCRAQLIVSSFGGALEKRFENVLANSHKSWKGVEFSHEHFSKVAEESVKRMSEPVLPPSLNGQSESIVKAAQAFFETAGSADVVYLSSESPDILTELKPGGVYIIGGLVDHNRHKGICYRRATELGIKTAKLPIGDFLNMQSRSVLATNHVVEIMLKWLELRDWGNAFMQVIPKRKGLSLKSEAEVHGENHDPGE